MSINEDISNYLQQLAPHIEEREAAQLLIKAGKEIAELKDTLEKRESLMDSMAHNNHVLNIEIVKQGISMQELATDLNEAAELIEGWSDIHKFDDWNRADQYRTLASQHLNKKG